MADSSTRFGMFRQTRRSFIRTTGAAAAGLAFGPSLLSAGVRRGSLPIGTIGAGNIGGAVGLRWAEAGHSLFFSSRNPEELAELASRAGPRAQAGYPEEAVRFGEVVLVAVPYGAMPQVGRDYAPLMQGKVVIDCGNPYPGRDGPMAEEALRKGTGVASAEYLPGVRLVRAFNAISYRSVESEAHRAGEKVAIPVAGDDPEAVRIATELVVDAGFDPVVVGGLESARLFDQGTDVYVQDLTAAELRSALGL